MENGRRRRPYCTDLYFHIPLTHHSRCHIDSPDVIITASSTGATFLMEGFKIHFGWTCAPDDVGCVPASTSEINTDKGLINGLFGTGAAM